jgi:hypothetical protein
VISELKTDRQGLVLVKGRRRDPLALGFGRFALVDRNGKPVHGELDSTKALTLDEAGGLGRVFRRPDDLTVAARFPLL